MRYLNALLMAMFIPLSSLVWAGQFVGNPVLYPEGCQQIVDQKKNEQKCKIKGILTYISSRDNLTWQVEEWKDGNLKSGLTDGASIPSWVQPIVGSRYDQSYLKAAIIHDHYCYE